jgi:hypothetical protein
VKSTGRKEHRGGRRQGAGRPTLPRLTVSCAYDSCRAVFVRPASSRRRFCSAICALRARPRPTRPKPSDRTCRECGQLFSPTRPVQAFCGSTCVALRNRREHTNPLKPERLREARRRHCARRRQQGASSLPAGRWREIGERDGWWCWICQKPVDQRLRAPNRKAPTVDHILPVSKGGGNHPSNLALAHFGCNSRRGAGRF